MKNTRSMLTAVTIVLLGTTAPLAFSDFAAARGGGHQDMGHHTDSGRSLATASSLRHTTNEQHGNREKLSKSASTYTREGRKGCGKLILPTAGCATPAHDPVGNTHPDLNANGATTVSNGVSKGTVPNGDGGLLVTSKTPGTITVSNGTNSVTLPGGSVALSGARSVGGGADVQILRQPNGDITVAAKPPAATPAPMPQPGGPAPTAPTAGSNHNTGPGSITVTTDDLKTAGKVVGVVGGAITVAPVVVGTAAGASVGADFGTGVAAGAAQVGATAVLPVAGAIAGYGFAKGGVSGAGEALKDSDGAVKDSTKDAAGAVKDAAKDVGGAVKDAASAIGDLF